MKTHKILKSHKTKFSNPIILNIGDQVNLGEEEKEEKWKGWIWVESKMNEGWVPIQILEILEDKKIAKVLESYSAKELNINQDDIVMVIKKLNGWSWSKNIKTEEEGWVPDENIE